MSSSRPNDLNAAASITPCGSVVGTLLILAFIALASLRFLAGEWSVNPQYSFGWGVPLLAIYLFWKRWPNRPAPAPLQKSYFFVFAAILALTALPLRLMLEANPDWRILIWSDLSILIAATLLTILFMGGRPWMNYFLIPATFILFAAPWPTRIEKFLIETLTHNIAGATVEAMNWIGIPALLRGNLIELRSAALGVNEACSGIRSVQTMLMTAIFFGELNRLFFFQRVFLVAFALAGTIFLNFLRTLLLAWIAATQGTGKEAAWHDKIGLLALLASIGAAWTISILWSKKNPAPTGEQIASRMAPCAARFFSWRTVTAIAAWIVAVEAFNEIWFRSREAKAESQTAWTISWPTPAQGFVRQELTDEVLTILRCGQNETGLWKKSDGSEWTMFFIKWGAGRMAAQLARGHTPDVCMTGGGFHMVADLGPVVLPAHNLKLPFETYVFEANGKPWFVFFCLSEDRVTKHAPLSRARDEYLSELEPHSRLRAVFEGKRFYGQQVFEIAISGYDSAKTALAALEKALPELVKVEAR